nr:MAG TPA: tail completion protein [Caudoviricetes sp.]
MINAIVEGISMALNAEFGDTYTIYAESVEQGLHEPCFFVACISPTKRIFLGRRYLATHQMCVQYFPDSKDGKREECNGVAERLFNCLEYIEAAENLTMGTKMHAEMVDGVLNFFVNYDFFLRNSQETTSMGELSLSDGVSVKG